MTADLAPAAQPDEVRKKHDLAPAKTEAANQ
jgi:hypothetical protein